MAQLFTYLLTAVYFLHSTVPGVMCLQLSVADVICRVIVLPIFYSILFCRCDVSFRRYYVVSSEEDAREKCVGQKFQLRLGRIFWGTNFSKFFTVNSKPLKSSNIWQNLVGLGSVAFVWEAWQ